MIEDAHFRLRIPRDLKIWVEETAKKNNRSITAEIISCLEIVRNDVPNFEERLKKLENLVLDEETGNKEMFDLLMRIKDVVKDNIGPLY